MSLHQVSIEFMDGKTEQHYCTWASESKDGKGVLHLHDVDQTDQIMSLPLVNVRSYTDKRIQ